jgi:hypothetical protein
MGKIVNQISLPSVEAKDNKYKIPRQPQPSAVGSG